MPETTAAQLQADAQKACKDQADANYEAAKAKAKAVYDDARS